MKYLFIFIPLLVLFGCTKTTPPVPQQTQTTMATPIGTATLIQKCYDDPVNFTPVEDINIYSWNIVSYSTNESYPFAVLDNDPSSIVVVVDSIAKTFTLTIPVYAIAAGKNNKTLLGLQVYETATSNNLQTFSLGGINIMPGDTISK